MEGRRANRRRASDSTDWDQELVLRKANEGEVQKVVERGEAGLDSHRCLKERDSALARRKTLTLR